MTLLRGLIEPLGARAHMTVTVGRITTKTRVQAKDITAAVKLSQQVLRRHQLIPTAVAHRIVHGGGIFWRPTRLTSAVTNHLRQMTSLAPLHMPVNLVAVTMARRCWPRATQIGVFDTAAFHDLPQTVQWYPLPLSVSKKFHIRKYGFHGISHQWAMEQAAKTLKKPVSQINVVTIHLGAGDSVAVWRHGRPLDTSMGFTPLEGLTMSTRSGHLDSSIPLFLIEHGYSAKRVEDMLERQSGLLGLTGLRDMRDILAAAGHPVAGWPGRTWTSVQRTRARFALAMFIHDIQFYVASYLGQLDRCDAIVLTGSIGQNLYIQRQIVRLPAARRLRCLTIPTDEEQAIATMVRRMVK